jgi:biopolymer transport protein ExbB/TolQ
MGRKPEPNGPDPAFGLPEDGRENMLIFWKRDPEARLGVRPGRFTDTNLALTTALGLFATAVVYTGLNFVRNTMVGQIFLGRGWVQYAITFLACWCLAILQIKRLKLRVQRDALGLSIVPRARDFVLAPSTAKVVLRRMDGLVDNPKHFVLLNRIELALSNLSHIGRISDVSEILVTQAENDEARMVSSYAIARGLIWAVPVLGFIGTVLGLSQAIGSFTGVLAQGADISQLTDALGNVTAGLSTAFDTTLLGLLAALLLHLLTTALVKREEDFLHECHEYCHLYIVGKLRLYSPGEGDTDAGAGAAQE